MREIVQIEAIESRIFTLRGCKVILDKDIAEIYGVKPIRLREQVKRNKKRFPADFMFQLNEEELDFVVSHFAIPSKKYFGGTMPYVFTEYGAVMLASVLNTGRAVKMSIFVVRAFIRMREMLSSYKVLLDKINKIEKQIRKHDEKIGLIFDILREFLKPKPAVPEKKIGF